MSSDENEILSRYAAKYHRSWGNVDPPWLIEDDTTEAFKRLVEGRTIVKITRDPDSGKDWSHGENSVKIILDNGAEIEFMGWGHDASGLDTSYSPAPELLGHKGEEG